MRHLYYSGVAWIIYITNLIYTNAESESREGIRALPFPSQRGVRTLRNTLSSLDDYLAEFQKRTCQFGLNSHHCALSALDSAMGTSEWLSSGRSPGKRALPPNEPVTEHEYILLLDDITEKRDHLHELQRLLDTAISKLTDKSKRTCMFNLGGRCATELASAIADQYYYLNGPSSPGRRRRRDTRSTVRV
ncbi:uncharacterized protein LOC127838424 [Dreissena polymorpha]|uniref:Uncharacterized protein n=1 Tax=Dreissena polymorpha TaxID=45954 RepID=A0A9D4RZK6_DREPO|nr:uncharacterized protein LOC127838424 [Dreissena polymorpha]KAH3884818.1 hypothetical protein DPMN_008803 [Dreissena polymorpha]